MAGEHTRDEGRMQELFDAAHRDQNLKQRLLTDPESVAKEWGVVLEQAEVDRLKKLGAFTEMAAEAKTGTLFRHCSPLVCYPSTVWLAEEVYDLLKFGYPIPKYPAYWGPPWSPYPLPIPRPYPPGYPRPEFSKKEWIMSRFGGFSRLSEKSRG